MQKIGYDYYPSQFIRHIKNPFYEIAFDDIEDLKTDVSFAISFMSLLKKRHDAVNKCNNSLHDDDSKFRTKVTGEIRCIPSYWRHLMKYNNSLETCRTSIQLERSNYLVKNPMTILSTYDPPCIELMAPINVDEKKIKDKIPILSISVSYATETFSDNKII